MSNLGYPVHRGSFSKFSFFVRLLFQGRLESRHKSSAEIVFMDPTRWFLAREIIQFHSDNISDNFNKIQSFCDAQRRLNSRIPGH